MDNYNTINTTTLAPISWAALIGGVLISLLGLWGMPARRDVDVKGEISHPTKSTTKV